MIDIIRINWYGRQTVYKEWVSNDQITNKLYYIHDGICTFIDDKQKHTFEKGSLYLIPSTAMFRPYSDENHPLDHTFVDFHFTPPIVSQKIYKLDPDISPLTKSTVDYFVKLIGNRKNTTYYPNDFDEGVLHMLIPSISLLVKQFIDLNSPTVPKNKLAISVMKDLIENIDTDITINDLAKKYYTSADVIIRTFKKFYHTTPYAYLKELRLKTAQHLIQSGEKLSNVANATNYADTSSLAHALKKHESHKTTK